MLLAIKNLPLGSANSQPLFYKLRNLSTGTYYWSVQAVDTSFKGGAFAVESSFVIE